MKYIGRRMLTIFLGTVVLFGWTALFWNSPVGKNMFKEWNDPSLTMEVLQENAEESGMYMLKEKGFFIYMALKKNDQLSMPMQILFYFLSRLLTVIMLVILLEKAKITTFIKRLFFILGMGLFVSLVMHLEQLIWWGFSPSYVFIDFMQNMVGFSLVGLMVGKLLPSTSV